MKGVAYYILVVVVLYYCGSVYGASPVPTVVDPTVSLVWQLVNVTNDTAPGPRSTPTGALHKDGQSWTIFGGERHKVSGNESAFLYNDLWDFEFSTNTWVPRPYGGQIFSATWRSALYTTDDRFLVWGGRNPKASGYIDASTISILPSTPEGSTSPPTWYQESAKFPTNQLSGYTWVAVDAIDQENGGITTILYVFGGTDSFEVTGTGITWKHTLATLDDWVEIHSKEVDDIPARYLHSAVYRPSVHLWYVFAGSQNPFDGINLQDLWSFNFTTEEWTRLRPLSACIPQARALHAASLHPEDIGMFVFGGLLNERTSVADLWMWHFVDSRWIQFKTAGWLDESNRRDGHLMTFWTDTAGGVWLYVFGGDLSNDKKLGFNGDAPQFNDLHRIGLSTAKIGCTDGIESCQFAYTEEECVGKINAGLSWKVWLIILAVVVGGALVVGVAIYVYQKYGKKEKEKLAQITYSDDEGF